MTDWYWPKVRPIDTEEVARSCPVDILLLAYLGAPFYDVLPRASLPQLHLRAAGEGQPVIHCPQPAGEEVPQRSHLQCHREYCLYTIKGNNGLLTCRIVENIIRSTAEIGIFFFTFAVQEAAQGPKSR